MKAEKAATSSTQKHDFRTFGDAKRLLVDTAEKSPRPSLAAEEEPFYHFRER